jgi:myosin-1
MLTTRTWPHWKGDEKEGAKIILEALKLKRQDYEFGKTKIFIRQPVTVSLANVLYRFNPKRLT